MLGNVDDQPVERIRRGTTVLHCPIQVSLDTLS